MLMRKISLYEGLSRKIRFSTGDAVFVEKTHIIGLIVFTMRSFFEYNRYIALKIL